MKLLLAAALLALPAAARAETDIYIGLTNQINPEVKLPLAVAPFIGVRGAPDALRAKELEGVVRDDLLASRYFSLSSGGPPPRAEATKDYLAAWSSFGARNLLFAKVSDLGDKAAIEARLFDLGTGEALLEKFYRDEPRRAAHLLADDVVQKLTGKRGIAASRIAFVDDATGHKELYAADYDGANPARLTEHKSIILLPRWSRDDRTLLFTSYKDGNPDLFAIDLPSREIRSYSARQGLNIAGGFSPDGSELVLTLSMGKNPNLYILKDHALRQLTSHSGIDTSATFSPDGRQIAFVSDRSGNPQVYVMELDSGLERRITHLNWCDTPTWSPSGEWIAFAGRRDPRDPFDIWLVDLTGNVMKDLTQGRGSNEDPSWSPDGRFLAFTSTRSGRREVYVMDADGSAPHALGKMNGHAFTPAWSY